MFLALGEDALPRRRFLQDVALVASDMATKAPGDLVFEWPQPGAAPDGHERAYRAFFLRQMERCTRAIVAGEPPVTLLGHPLPDASGPLGSHFYVAAGPCDAAAKKRLWHQLREWMTPT